MATATAADYSTTSAANGLYYPLSSNPAGYLTSAPVTSVAGRTGAISLAVADISGAAPLASPALTGTPTAPTATLGTNTTQIATTAFVLANAPAAPVTSVAGRTGAITLAVADVSGAAPLASPTFTGTVTIPSGASISGYLTTTAGDAAYYPLTGNPSGFLTSAPVTSVAGRTGAITLANTDISGLGTMATATAADYSTTTVANGLYYPLSSNPAGYLTSAPVSSVAGRTGAITLAVADVSGAAPLASPTFTGTPSLPTGTTAVTQTLADNSTKLATTAYVDGSIPANSVKAWVNFNGVALTGTYSRTGTLVTVTMTAHGMTTGQNARLDFTTGTATDGAYTVTVTGVNTFTITDTASGTTSGNVTRQAYIRASMNVSSITDNGVGDYTVNFTTAMADANYATSMAYSFEANGQHTVGFLGAPNTSPAATYLAGSCRMSFYNPSNFGGTADKVYVTAIFTR
jgi:hypothetical protein